MLKIDQKIVGYSVVEKKDAPPMPKTLIQRPDTLSGMTYKIKTPLSDHALYITINNIVLDDGSVYPFEIFINSKAMENFQWIVALTRMVSAVFRQGGNVAFIVEELKAVFDPRGGYFKKGGKFMPSLVAEIGDVIEQHLIGLGIIVPDTSLADAARGMVEEKQARS